LSDQVKLIIIFLDTFDILYEAKGLGESFLYARGLIEGVILPKWGLRRNHFKRGLEGCVVVKVFG